MTIDIARFFMASPLVDALVAIPRIIQDPRGLALRKRTKRKHPRLIQEPVHLRARGSHMLAGAEFIFVRDGIHHVIHLIDVRAHNASLRTRCPDKSPGSP